MKREFTERINRTGVFYPWKVEFCLLTVDTGFLFIQKKIWLDKRSKIKNQYRCNWGEFYTYENISMDTLVQDVLEDECSEFPWTHA